MKRIVWMLLVAALLGTPGRARADHFTFSFTGVDTSQGTSVPISGTFGFSDPSGTLTGGILTNGPRAGTRYGYYNAPEATLSFTEAGQTHAIDLMQPVQLYTTLAGQATPVELFYNPLQERYFPEGGWPTDKPRETFA